MPDFNFAKGGSRREEGTPRRGSVLDRYPSRDLSHLEEGGAQERKSAPSGKDSAAAAAHASASPADAQPSDENAGAADSETASSSAGSSVAESSADDSGTAAGGGDGGKEKAASSRPSSTWPLIALIAVVLFLIVIAFIWHVDPWPALRENIAGLFRSDAGTKQTVAPPARDAGAMDEEPPIPVRSWDYFVQVSSWKDLGKADLDAERYRAQGLDVIVESEYIPAKRGTFYRVRLGPYASSEMARGVREQHAGILPAGVFIDSTRLSDDEFLPPDQAAGTASLEADGPAGQRREAIPGGAEFDLLDQPLSGWAVKVSSFKESDIARSEARKLLSLGYPSFITRTAIGGKTWYRVLVGPFSEKHDADRYMELLNVTHGNEAYTVNLATY